MTSRVLCTSHPNRGRSDPTAGCAGRCGTAITFLVLALGAAPLAALDPAKDVRQYVCDRWTAAQGLPRGPVLVTTQTSDGYLWLGTQEGLARFDGMRFTVFDRSNTPLFAASSVVQALHEDRAGALWVGTEGGGLLRLKDGEWRRFSAADGLGSDVVYAITEDSGGTLWFGSYGGGLSSLRGDRWSRLTTRDGLSSDRIRTLLVDGDGSIWIGTEDSGLDHYRDGRITHVGREDGLPSLFVRALCQDRAGDVWVGTAGGGLAVRRGDRWATLTKASGLPDERVYALCEDRDGNLWVGTEGGGLARLYAGRFSQYAPPQGFSSNIVNSVFEDREGNLWVGTAGGGLNRIKDGRWSVVTTEDGLAANLTWCVYEDREGTLWVGTESGLCRYRAGRWTTFTTRDGLPHPRVRSLVQDRMGTLWVGTGGGGLARFRDGRFTTFTPRTGFPSDLVFALLEDSAGRLWVGTYGAGLLRKKGDGAFERITTRDGLGSDRIRCVAETGDGSLWVATFGAGVTRLKDARWTTFLERDGLGSDRVLTLSVDSEGVLWAGTYSGGISRFSDGRWTSFSREDGLCEDGAFAIIDDRLGNLWVSSNRGVYSVARADLAAYQARRIPRVPCVAYGEADGLTAPECNGGSQPSGWRTRDGRLWFPTIGGVAVLDPSSRVPVNRKPPPVVMESATIDGRAVATGTQAEIPPGRHRIEITFAALSLVASERNRYRTMLEGFDREWQPAGTDRAAVFTGLPPGSYVFRVIACNNDGIWNTVGARFAFRLKPHFYQAGWFYVLCAALAVLASRAVHDLRLRNLKARERTLVATVAERTGQLNEANVALQHRSVELERANRQLEDVNRDLAAANARLHELTVQDPLTGIANRRHLEEVLEHEWRRAFRSGAPLAVAMVDIDHFKAYNDRFGHQAGDECLKRVAACLSAALRRAADIVARYGGEEFAAVLPDTDADAALQIAELLRARVADAGIPSASTAAAPVVTVSIGVACRVPAEHATPSDLVADADRALYLAKQAGRNRVVGT